VTASVFTAVFIAMLVGHHLGDYLLQTTWQVEHKGNRGWIGWLAAGGHVASYTVATSITTLVAAAALHLPITGLGFVAAQLFSAGTHLVIDRRFTLRWFVEQVDKLIEGKLKYYDTGGAAFIDQMAHILCLYGASLLAVAVTA